MVTKQNFSDLAKSLEVMHTKASGTLIVAVDGCGGSGKSTFAASLCSVLEGFALVHTDDFASWEQPFDWGERLQEQVLEPLRRKETAHYQRYDWTEKTLAEWHSVEPGGIVVIEGVGSSRKEFRAYLGFSIFVECPREVRLARGLARDGQEALPLWEEWMRAEDEYVIRDDPRERANLVINGKPETPLDPSLEFEVLRAASP